MCQHRLHANRSCCGDLSLEAVLCVAAIRLSVCPLVPSRLVTDIIPFIREQYFTYLPGGCTGSISLNFGVRGDRTDVINHVKFHCRSVQCLRSDTPSLAFSVNSSRRRYNTVGCVVQRYNIRLSPACFRCPALDL